MNNFIRSVFTYTTILSSYIGAIGYGFGYALLNYYGINTVLCIFFSLLLGFLFDKLASFLLSYKPFIGSKKRKIIFAVIIYLVYFIAWYFVNKFFIYDLDEDFLSNLLLILIFQMISFIIYCLKEIIIIRKKKR